MLEIGAFSKRTFATSWNRKILIRQLTWSRQQCISNDSFRQPIDVYPRYRICNNIIIYIVHFIIRLDRNVEHDTTVAETWNIILRARHDDLWSDFTRILQQRFYDNATPLLPSFRLSAVTVLAIFYHLFIDLIICFITISSGSRRTDNATAAAVVMDPYGVSDHVYDYDYNNIMLHYRKPFMLHYAIIIWIYCITMCFLCYTTHQRPASLCNGALRYRIPTSKAASRGGRGVWPPLAPLENNLFKLPMSYILFMVSTPSPEKNLCGRPCLRPNKRVIIYRWVY